MYGREETKFANRRKPVSNSVGKRWDAELLRKQRLTPEGQEQLRARARVRVARAWAQAARKETRAR
jgi:hypothetical protein